MPPSDPHALPPGPRDGVLSQTIRLHRDPLGFLRAGQVEFGDVFTIQLLTARPVVVAAAPEAIEELLASDPETAHAGEARRSVLPFASPRSVFGGDGAAHRAAEAHVSPTLSRQAVDEGRAEMEAIATRHAEALPRERPFRLLERVREVTDEIFVRLRAGRPVPVAPEPEPMVQRATVLVPRHGLLARVPRGNDRRSPR